MTSDEWRTCIDPTPMIQHLGPTASKRKLRFYACAWGYSAWGHMRNECSREAVIVADRFADGLADLSELTAAYRAAHAVWKDLSVAWGIGRKRLLRGRWAERRAAGVARQAANPNWGLFTAQHARGNAATNCALADFLRDIFGNPFHHVIIDPAWLTWNDGTVPKIAQAIYDESELPSGHLDAGGMAILADALEDAGCQDAELLAHLRGPGPHVRGCHAIDALLGKE